MVLLLLHSVKIIEIFIIYVFISIYVFLLNVFLRTVEKLQQGDKKYIACQILSLPLLDVHDHDSPRWTETPTLGLICINCAQFRLGAMPIKQ